jgi:hypothetical protein
MISHRPTLVAISYIHALVLIQACSLEQEDQDITGSPVISTGLTGPITLKTNNGHYVWARNGGGGEISAISGGGNTWETFTMVVLGNNKVAFRCYDGKHYLSALNGGGTTVNASAYSIGTNETFTMIGEATNTQTAKSPDGEESNTQTAKSSLISIMKTKGCVWEGLLSGFGTGETDSLIALLNRSGCQYLHRAIDTWPVPPDFDKAKSIMAKITKKNLIYGMENAESINTSANYYYPDEQRNFDFASMCKKGTSGKNAWGGTCVPTLASQEYQKFVLYIAQQGIDIGIQDISFGQPYLYDTIQNPILPSIISKIKAYAKSKGKKVVCGGQTNDIDDESYLRAFDYIWGGLGQDTNGNIENSECSSKWTGFCWALLWHPKWASKANDVLLHLDWYGDPKDDLDVFTRFSHDLRSTFLTKMYNFFKSKNMGFLIPYFAPKGGTEGCSAQNGSYSPDDAYSCKDESTDNKLLGKDNF